MKVYRKLLLQYNLPVVFFWFQIFLHVLAKFLCVFDGNICCSVHKQSKKHVNTSSPKEESTFLLNSNSQSTNEGSHPKASETDDCTVCDCKLVQNPAKAYHCTLKSLQCSINEVKSLLIRINDLATKKKEENLESKQVALEWKNISRVCDRIFFLMYLCGVIIPLFTLFPRPDVWSFEQ